MDTTPKYIKMCEKAEEIQNLWKKQDGDYYYEELKKRQTGGYKQGTHIFCYGCNYDRCSHEITKNTEKFIWLPRQDQLQKMVCNKPKSGDKIIDRHLKFHNWFIDGMPDTWVNNLSFEQLWLAFVMHEKYGKHWDNKKEEWVK